MELRTLARSFKDEVSNVSKSGWKWIRRHTTFLGYHWDIESHPILGYRAICTILGDKKACIHCGKQEDLRFIIDGRELGYRVRSNTDISYLVWMDDLYQYDG